MALGLAARTGDRITANDGLRARVVESGPELLAHDLATTIAAPSHPRGPPSTPRRGDSVAGDASLMISAK